MKLIARGTILDTAAAKVVAAVYQSDDKAETHVKLYRKDFDVAALTDAVDYAAMIEDAEETVPGVLGNEDYTLVAPTAVDFTRVRAVPGTEDGKVNVYAQMRYTVTVDLEAAE